MTTLTSEAQRVHETAQLSDRVIAAATGAQPSTVRDWLSGRSSPSGTRAHRLIELAEMTDRLVRVIILSAGLVFADVGALEPAVYVLAALSTVTVVQRILHVKGQLVSRPPV